MKTNTKPFVFRANPLALLVLLLIVVMAVVSLLPRKPQRYTTYALPGGITLEGQILLPGKTGEGTITFPDKTIYRGHLTDGHLDGKVEIELTPAYKMTGTFQQGSLLSGNVQSKGEGSFVLDEDGQWARKEVKK